MSVCGRAACIAAVVLGFDSQAYATPVVYDNGGPNQFQGAEMTQWVEAEDFTLAVGTTLTDIRFWSVQDDVKFAGPYQGSISWEIYAHDVAQPGLLLASGNTAAVTRSATGNSLPVELGSLTEYQNDFSLPGVFLAPGTYWLGLHNGPLSTIAFSQFYWETTNANATLFSEHNLAPFDDDDWVSNAQQLAFQLAGETGVGPAAEVPEPMSLLLLGTGLLVVARHQLHRKPRLAAAPLSTAVNAQNTQRPS
jgi:PEP-CTERM motif